MLCLLLFGKLAKKANDFLGAFSSLPSCMIFGGVFFVNFLGTGGSVYDGTTPF